MSLTNIMQDPEAGQRHLNTDEKIAYPQLTIPSSCSSIRPPRRRWCCIEMPQFRSFLITIVITAFLTFAYASAIHHRQSFPDVAPPISPPDQPRFEQLLSQVSDHSLHDVLHRYVTFKYQHGVYPEDRKAVQAIHDDNPAVGTSLVELARRQGNGTITATTSVAQATTSVVVVASTTSTESQASTASAGTSQQQQTTTSAQKTTTTPATIPAGTTTSAATTTSKQAASTTSVNTSVFVSEGGGTTDSTTTRAATTTASVKSQQVIYTTTLPNGARSTVTYVTVIPADATASTPGVTATGSAQLQSTASGMSMVGGWQMVMGLGVWVAVAILGGATL